MILVILAIGIILCIVGGIGSNISEDEETIIPIVAFIAFVIGAILTVICLIAISFLCVRVSELKVINQQIEMYAEENQAIEAQIDEAVKFYMEWESETYGQFTNENSIILAQLFPGLKSSELISKQLDVYIENNNKIRELKSEQINGSVKKWWLYFGG